MLRLNVLPSGYFSRCGRDGLGHWVALTLDWRGRCKEVGATIA